MNIGSMNGELLHLSQDSTHTAAFIIIFPKHVILILQRLIVKFDDLQESYGDCLHLFRNDKR